MLQHSFFVANDDLGCVEVHQFPQTVVAVDDPAVEVVEVTGGEVTAFQHDQRTQIRWDHRDHFHYEPAGFIARTAKPFDQLQTLAKIFDLLLALGFGESFTQFFDGIGEIEVLE